MIKPLLGTFGLALALAVSGPAMAQMHSGPAKHDDHKGPPAKGPAMHKDNFGSWNNSWGARPSAPPAFWAKKNDWYRHVRVCQVKYRTYDARTDTYRIGKKAVRCKL